ncbi:MAG: hypothetical protein WA488_19510 [Mycobacterium sp.]|uniref:DUF5666 domain-containing protein n=1 Tax=Mycobacterium sp. TaxID=1785 RepID=UPI003CC27C3F
MTFTNSPEPRLTWPAILVVAGAIAVSVVACDTSTNEHTGAPTSSPSPTSAAAKPPPPPAPPIGNDHIEGLVDSVSGNTIRLTQRNRTAATVDFSPQTMVTELTPAKLPDVTAGSCIDVEASPNNAPPGGAIAAQAVTISPAVGGKCPPPEPPAPGSAGTPPAAPPSGAPTQSPGVYGTVASITGNTIEVTGTDPTGKTTHTNLTVTDTTTYTKHAVTNDQAIQQGKCMAAQGTADNGGVLQAETIDLEPCPPMGRPRHHFHFPHLPHPHHF